MVIIIDVCLLCAIHFKIYFITDQSAEDAEQLDDISVSDGVEATKQRVGDGNDGGYDDSDTVVYLNDDGQSRTCKRQVRDNENN